MTDRPIYSVIVEVTIIDPDGKRRELLMDDVLYTDGHRSTHDIGEHVERLGFEAGRLIAHPDFWKDPA